MKIIASLLMVMLFSGVLTVSFASWIWVLRRWATEGLGDLFRQNPTKAPSRWGVVDLLVSFVIYVGISGGLVGILRGIWFGNEDIPAGGRATAVLIFVAGVAQLVAVGLATAFVRWRTNASLARSGWDFSHLLEDVQLALFAFGLVIIPVFILQATLVQFVKYEHPAITPFKESKDWFFFASAAFAAVLTAPLGEEFFFRGMLQGWLERISVFGAKDIEELMAPKSAPVEMQPVAAASASVEEAPPAEEQNPYAYLGTEAAAAAGEASEEARPIPHWPVWATSAIFALLHFSQGPAPVPLFLFSVAMGYVYRRTGRIVPSLIMHFLLNGLSMAMLGLSAFLPEA